MNRTLASSLVATVLSGLSTSQASAEVNCTAKFANVPDFLLFGAGT